MSEAPAIAIIGLAGRWPGAPDEHALWSVLTQGIETVAHFTRSELEYSCAENDGATTVAARGILPDVDCFDADFFGISPREAALMDPQHRIFLETAWAALENAALDPTTFKAPIGVYAGTSLNTYLLWNLCATRNATARVAGTYQVADYLTFLGNDKDFMPTRVSHRLGLTGPSMAVQSACSTSLVAVSQACQALLAYECDAAIAGGVSITFPQRRDYPYIDDAMVSPDGHCRPFDAAAQGTVFGHGVGAVVLRRLDDALAEGYPIRAVIRGTAVNNDGGGKVSFTAPGVDGQAAVVAQAQAMAGVDPRDISYVECHGTGTPLGDPIEIAALTHAFRRRTAERNFCRIGTAKGNLGHLDIAAGVTGLIKTVLSLEHRELPPLLHYTAPNPHIDFAASPFIVNDRLTAWNPDRLPRRAGVSAFGVGGTNAHVVVEEAPAPAQVTVAGRSQQVLVLSAKTPLALAQQADRLATYLTHHPATSLADVAFTLQAGRARHQHRRTVVSSDHAEAIRLLAADKQKSTLALSAPEVVFLFPGQGAQSVNMGRALYDHEPLFRRVVDEGCALAAPLIGCDLRAIIYPSAADSADAQAQLNQTQCAQPALFIIGYALAQQWLAWGITPTAMLGHSVGEYVAACLAGVFSVHDALRIIAERCRLMQHVAPGAMLAVRLSEAEVLPLLSGTVALAAINAPNLCVVAGPLADIADFERDLNAREIVTRRLHTSHAFHSPMMEPVLAPFRDHLRQIQFNAPRLPYCSSVTGTWITPEQAVDPEYWVNQLRQPVRFGAGVQTLSHTSQRIFLEVGPGEVVSQLARQNFPAESSRSTAVALASLPAAAGTPAPSGMLLATLGSLWALGVTVDWAAVHGSAPRRRVPLPTYPFARDRHWIEPAPLISAPSHPRTEAPSLSAQSSPDEPVAPAAQLDRNHVLALTRTLFEELSGRQLTEADRSHSFTELGFDSLLLTQATMAIRKRFKLKVTFRQLLDQQSTLDALADFIDTNWSGPERTASASKPAARASAAVAVSPASTDSKAEFKPFGPYKPVQKGQVGGLTPRQEQHLSALIARYNARTATSKALTQKHRRVLADPRVAAGFRAQWKDLVYPIVTNRSSGSRLWDVDGNEYIDLLNGFGPIMLGHNPPWLTAALTEQLHAGFEIGPQTPLAGEVAEKFCALTGNERATFCNTGSEAVMAALRLARTVTGRDTIVIFAGSYHGIFDEVLVKAVKRGTIISPAPIAPGIPQEKVAHLLVLDYGTDEALRLIREHADELAAVLVEPIQSRHPALRPAAFLLEVRRITTASGAALIFDEVVTGFRTGLGGAQDLFKIRADLASYGKVAGGGIPIGILAGRAQFMDALDGGMWTYGDDSFPEVGVTFFAGTFVRHPLALAACKAVLQHLEQAGPQLQERLAERTARLVERLQALFAANQVPTRIETFSSWFYFLFPSEYRFASLFYYLMRERGIHIQEGFPCFLSTAHSDEDLATIYRAFAATIAEMQAGEFLLPQQAAGGDSNAALIPLSDSQRELWLSSQLSPAASASYNESLTIDLRGELDLSALQLAIAQIIDRHPALRAVFSAYGHHQRLLAQVKVAVPLVDLSALDQTAREAAFAAHIAADARLPFTLDAPPLVRTTLIRCAPAWHRLVWTAHHLVCDGWSGNVILEELGALYSAARSGTLAALPPACSYATFVETDAAHHASPAGEADAAFWRAHFTPLPPTALLPADAPRQLDLNFPSGMCSLTLDPELVRALRTTAAHQRTTVYQVLLAAYRILIARLCGEADVLIGCLSAGQLDYENAALVGHCVKVLPLRCPVDEQVTFAEHLTRQGDVFAAMLEHRRLSFGRLTTLLGLAADSGRPPLMTTLFNLERVGEHLAFSGLAVAVTSNPKAHEIFDLVLNGTETTDSLIIDAEFNAQLFTSPTITRWLDSFATLLRGIVADAHAPVAALPWMSAAEREHVISTFNRTAAAVPRSLRVDAEIAAHAIAQPQATALVAADQLLSYAALAREVHQLARHLRQLGVQPGTRVVICAARSPALIVALLAIWRAGAAYVPVDPAYPRERMAWMIRDAEACVVITDAASVAALPATKIPVLRLDDSAAPWRHASPAEFAPSTDPDATAYVIYTSGSTGTPKGVIVSHRNLAHALAARRPLYGDRPERHLLLHTIAFDSSVPGIFATLAHGGTLVIPHPDLTLDGPRLATFISDQRVSQIDVLPSFYRILLTSAPIERFATLTTVTVGGESLPASVIAEHHRLLPQVKLINEYGPTEGTICCCAHLTHPAQPAHLDIIGRPIGDNRLYVLNDRGEPAPVGIAGELFLSGPQVAQGYLNQPQLTAERFIPDRFTSEPGARMYRTGDRARWLADGHLCLVGRRDDQIKLRGYRIELGEIEAALAAQPGVAQAAAIFDQTAGQPRVLGYVVAQTNTVLDPLDVRRGLGAHVPTFMIPDHLVVLDRLPLLTNGKLDRSALPRPRTEKTALGAALAPRTPHEQTLLTLCREVLRQPDLNLDDDLFAHGLNSIQLFDIIGRAARSGLTLTPQQLFQQRTISASLQRREVAIESAAPSTPSLLLSLQPHGPRTPFFFVGGFLDLAKHVGPDQPFYGLDCPAEAKTATVTFDLLAARCIAEIRRVQPHGPYQLGGHCFGAIVAFAIAQQLAQDNERVSFLGLFDPPIPPRCVVRTRTFDRWRYHLGQLFRQHPRDYLSYISDRVANVRARLAHPTTDDGDEDARLYENFTPTIFPGRIAVFMAKDTYLSLSPEHDPRLMWRTWARDGIEIIDCPGDHIAFCREPLVANLGLALRQRLASP